jgi:hypothetical protein
MKGKPKNYLFEVTTVVLNLMLCQRTIIAHRSTFATVTAIFIATFDVIQYSANADVVQLKNYYSQNSENDSRSGEGKYLGSSLLSVG